MAGGEGETEEDHVEGELKRKSEGLGFNFKFYHLALDRKSFSFFGPSFLHLSCSGPGLVGVGVGQMDRLGRGTESHTTVKG